MVDNHKFSVYHLWISYPHFIPMDFWAQFIDSIKEDFQKKQPVVFLILKQLKLLNIDNDQATLVCDNQPLKNYIEKNLDEVEEQLSIFAKKKLTIKLIIQSDRKKTEDAPLLTFEPTIEDQLIKRGFSRRYSLENFAVSPANQIAYAAAQAVIDRPGTAYNPLFLYGGVGVGKTHLAQSIGRRVFENNPQRQVFFCPGDQFTNELIESIREKNTAKFRKKYRRLNLLVVDDIQFIAGKRTVQEEFFHTFNSVMSAGGQIVLTSDRPPSEIKDLEDRLKSRFSGGLTIDLQPPDFELRTAIILIKAREKNIEIEIEAAKVIAERVEDSRSLEGCLLSLYARTLGKKDRIDMETALAFFSEKKENGFKRLFPEDVIKSVANYFNLKPGKLKGEGKESEVVLPRQLSMYFLRKYLHLKLNQIAFFLNRKDHTTVIHAVNKIERLIAKDPLLKKEVDQLIESLGFST